MALAHLGNKGVARPHKPSANRNCGDINGLEVNQRMSGNLCCTFLLRQFF